MWFCKYWKSKERCLFIKFSVFRLYKLVVFMEILMIFYLVGECEVECLVVVLNCGILDIVDDLKFD